MAEATRVLTWQQGNVLTDDCALKLGLCLNEEIGSKFFVIVSHDCDLTATSDKEPKVEVITATPINKLGSSSHAKIARRLDLEFQRNKSSLFLELIVTNKQFIDKESLFKFLPSEDIKLDGDGLITLRRWLAARYYRAAFPESFEARLRAAPKAGKKSFFDQIELVLEQGGAHIRSVLFELDEGKNIERADIEDCYPLGIIVLYDSSKNEPVAATAAEQIAQQLESLFSTAFYSSDSSKWLGIELLYCDAISDAVLTVADRERLREWRLEHMSLRESPVQVMSGK